MGHPVRVPQPAIGLILVSLYGASAGEVGLALAAYNVSGFVSTLVVPTRADRSGDYLRPLLWCGGFTIALTTALALATTLPLAVLALVALGGPAGLAIGLIFAYQRYTGATVQQIMRTRAVFSFAWVGGPPLAAFLMGFFGNRSVLWVVAGLGVLGLVLTRVMMREHGRSAYAGSPPPSGDRMSVALRRPDVVILLVTFVALGAALSAAVSVLPLFVTQELGSRRRVERRRARHVRGARDPHPRHPRPAHGALRPASPRRVRVRQRARVLRGDDPGHRPAWCWSAPRCSTRLFIATMSGVGLTLFQDVLGRPGLASSSS